jgi:hypothetical protein
MTDEVAAEGWVVLLEATTQDVSLEALDDVLTRLETHAPSALLDPGRCAIQLHVHTSTPEAALSVALSSWRAAVSAGGARWRLVRAELCSPDEMADDWRRHHEAVDRITEADAVEAAYGATRRLLWIGDAHDAAVILGELTHSLGGNIVPARPAHPFAIPLDVSFGVTDPMTPVAPPGSPSRRYLEDAIPVVARDAWRMLRIQRGQGCAAYQPRMRLSDN